MKPRALRVGLAVLCTALLAGAGALARSPWHVEAWYVEGVGPLAQGLLGAVPRLAPFSVAEPLVVGAVAVALVWLVVRARSRRFVDAALELWAAAALVGVWFYAGWGLAYSRPPAQERLGWASAERPLAPIEARELQTAGEGLVDVVNALYLELHHWPDAYSPSRAPGGPASLDRAIELGYQRLAAEEGLSPTVGRSRGPAKRLGSSLLFTWLGIGGIYWPFTGEANVNALQPEWQLAHTIAHEMAHQRFFASEDEANFFGFLAGVRADDPFVRYGAWLFAQRQVLGALGQVDPYGFYDTIERRLPGVQRDVDHSRAFWARYDGPASALGGAVNNQYLKFQGVEGGTASYSRSLVLVIEWLRRHPERLAPGAPDAPAADQG